MKTDCETDGALITTHKQRCSAAGASITGGYWTEQGGEDLLKKLVAEHGAVMTGVAAAGPFSAYKVSCDWSRHRSADL